MRRSFDKSGYIRYHFNSKGSSLYVHAHRCVALAFIPNPDNKPCIDHINGNKLDNRVENLRWVTVLENQNNITTKTRIKKSKQKPIAMLSNDGIVLKTFSCLTDAAKEVRCHTNRLSNACITNTPYKGYRWLFIQQQIESYKEYG